MKRFLIWYMAIFLPLMVVGLGIYGLRTIEEVRHDRQQRAQQHFEILYRPLLETTQQWPLLPRARQWQQAIDTPIIEQPLAEIQLLALTIRDGEGTTHYGLYSKERFAPHFPEVAQGLLIERRKIGEEYITKGLDIAKGRRPTKESYYTFEALYALLFPADYQHLVQLALLAALLWLFVAGALLLLRHVAIANNGAHNGRK